MVDGEVSVQTDDDLIYTDYMVNGTQLIPLNITRNYKFMIKCLTTKPFYQYIYTYAHETPVQGYFWAYSQFSNTANVVYRETIISKPI